MPSSPGADAAREVLFLRPVGRGTPRPQRQEGIRPSAAVPSGAGEGCKAGCRRPGTDLLDQGGFSPAGRSANFWQGRVLSEDPWKLFAAGHGRPARDALAGLTPTVDDGGRKGERRDGGFPKS